MSYNDNVLYDGLRWDADDIEDSKKLAAFQVERSVQGVDRETLPYIHTYFGIKWRHTWPLREDVHIEDIAHALSHLCRFAGHLKSFYSVAEHSVRVSYACDPADAFSGLMHDGSEAYCVDMPRPLKRAPGMEIYRYYEDKTGEAIRAAFLLPPEPESVKAADLRLLATEKRDLFIRDSSWAVNKGEYGVPLPETIYPWTSEQARNRFLMRFHELTGRKEFFRKYESLTEN